jgi:uncharacterized membrane protein HdeD (DUF308 family)
LSQLENTSAHPTAEPTRSWKTVLALGVLTTIVGIVLVLNLAVTALVITLLVGVTLIIAGIERIISSGRARHRILAIVIGVVGIILGVIAISAPGITLVAVAFAVGIGFLVSGAVGELLGLQTSQTKGRTWLLLTAVLDIVIGVLALALPGPTILVLCLVFGIRAIIAGLSDIAYAWSLRRSATAGPASPGRAVAA